VRVCEWSDSEEEKMKTIANVLYVYRCVTCGHRGHAHFADDSHDGEATNCGLCGATVAFEWDGGVDLKGFFGTTPKDEPKSRS
jgi:transcription elongation factor Elf1